MSSAAQAQPGVFATTHWSVVLTAGAGSHPAARRAWDELARLAWQPLTNLLGGFNGNSAGWPDPSATHAPTRYYRAVLPDQAPHVAGAVQPQTRSAGLGPAQQIRLNPDGQNL